MVVTKTFVRRNKLCMANSTNTLAANGYAADTNTQSAHMTFVGILFPIQRYTMHSSFNFLMVFPSESYIMLNDITDKTIKLFSMGKRMNSNDFVIISISIA